MQTFRMESLRADRSGLYGRCRRIRNPTRMVFVIKVASAVRIPDRSVMDDLHADWSYCNSYNNCDCEPPDVEGGAGESNAGTEE